MFFSCIKSAFLYDNNFGGVFAGVIFLFNNFPVCSILVREYDVFCMFNALLIDDKQFFIIDIINTFFSYKWNIDWQYCITALDIFITIIMSVCQVIIWERLGLLLINGMTSDFHW